MTAPLNNGRLPGIWMSDGDVVNKAWLTPLIDVNNRREYCNKLHDTNASGHDKRYLVTLKTHALNEGGTII